MGLDMYLYGERYYPGYAKEHPRDKDSLGREISGETVDLGYWRKHPDLHGFIVQTFADGKDECQRIELSLEALRQILLAVKDESLPHTTGFFFGASETATDQDTVAKLEEAIKWLETEEPGAWKSVYYQASW